MLNVGDKQFCLADGNDTHTYILGYAIFYGASYAKLLIIGPCH